MRRSIIFFYFFLSINAILAQKVLKLDTPRNPSRMSFLIGSTITFQTEGDDKKNKIWTTRRITGFDLDRHQILFDDWAVTVEDISAVRKGNERRFIHKTGAALFTFGTGAAFFGMLGKLTPNCPNCNEAMVIGASSGVVGWLLTRISGFKTFKIDGKNNKLRLLDLTPKPEKPSDKV
ncbi:MAG: hypothetical protein JNL70_07660 [Saprospiraceae bacterium]|nr:hypothetical protein [Saprospiraceae bacterium]